MLRRLAKVRVEFFPFDTRTTGVRELWFQLNSKKSVASNPKCELGVLVRGRDAMYKPPQVFVTYTDGTEQVIDASTLSVDGIKKEIDIKRNKLDLDEVITDGGGKWEFCDAASVQMERMRRAMAKAEKKAQKLR
eukprot:jgi/Mesvir1/608/Mv02042-RA.1